MLSRERLRVTGSEPVGPYTLLRVERGRLDPGIPGQFFMLEAPGRVLPRPGARGAGAGRRPRGARAAGQRIPP